MAHHANPKREESLLVENARSLLASSEPRLLMIADISGYTSFLEAVQQAHPETLDPHSEAAPAYAIVSHLLDVVMAQIATQFALVQVEGDALFVWTPESRFASHAGEFLGVVRSAYAAFREQLRRARERQRRHECSACVVLTSLELKFVLHLGVATPQRVAGRELLAGPAVNLTHRILKNSITQQTGLRAYLFATDAATRSLGLALPTAIPFKEQYPDAGMVSGLVLPLADQVARY